MSTTKNATATDNATVVTPKGASTEKKLSKTERRAQRKADLIAKQTPPAKDAKGATPQTAGKTTTPEKKKTKATKQLENANIEIAGAKAEGKELLYKYPDEVKTQSQKKDFRRKARAENKKFSRELAQLKRSTDKNAPKELAAMEKKFTQFRKETYSKG